MKPKAAEPPAPKPVAHTCAVCGRRAAWGFIPRRMIVHNNPGKHLDRYTWFCSRHRQRGAEIVRQ